MKVIQIEYPDKNVHKVVVSEYNHSNDTNLDYINYYDLANDRNMYSILKEAEGKIFNDTELYDFTYNELIRDIERKDLDDLPSIIPLYMENEKFIYQNQEPDYVQYQQLVQKFIVYHIEDTNRFYVDAKICEKYNVGKGIYIINDKKCKLVTETEIKDIEERSVNHNPRLEAEIKTISFKKEEIKYKVYNLENKILIEDSISKKYNVGKGIFYINNKLCREIAKEEIFERTVIFGLGTTGMFIGDLISKKYPNANILFIARSPEDSKKVAFAVENSKAQYLRNTYDSEKELADAIIKKLGGRATTFIGVSGSNVEHRIAFEHKVLGCNGLYNSFSLGPRISFDTMPFGFENHLIIASINFRQDHMEKAIEMLSVSNYDKIVELIDRDEFTQDPIGAYREKIYSKNAPLKTAVIWNEKYVDRER